MEEGGSAVDAVVHGCSTCELLQCDGSGTKSSAVVSVNTLEFGCSVEELKEKPGSGM
jgi:hypothetical protein